MQNRGEPPVVTSAPAKVILFGEHGVNRQQPALCVAVGLRLLCQVSARSDDGYSLRSGQRHEAGSRAQLLAFKVEIDALRQAQALDAIRERARDFFAPPRYVLAHVAERAGRAGFDVAWRSPLPVGSGMGSGAAASTAMILGALQLAGQPPTVAELAHLAWQGDAIAHGGISSSLDSSTCAYGGLIRFTVAAGPQPLPLAAAQPGAAPLPLVIADSQVAKSTAEANTRIRKWLEEHPARMHLFGDMGYLVRQAEQALAAGDLDVLGHLMNLHQLFQEKLGTSWPQAERLIEAAIGAGALGAKISGSGLGGIVIALAAPGQERTVAAAMETTGGRCMVVAAGVEGTRIETAEAWT